MDLLHRIHSESTATSLEANLASYVNEIKTFLDEGGGISSSADATFAERYYVNHIGRELNTQIIRFDLEKYFEYNGGHGGITLDNPYGGGYRPESNISVYSSAGGEPPDADDDGTPDDEDDFPNDPTKDTSWTPNEIISTTLIGWWDPSDFTTVHATTSSAAFQSDPGEVNIQKIADKSDFGNDLTGTGVYSGGEIFFQSNDNMTTSDWNSTGAMSTKATFFIVASVMNVDHGSDAVMSYLGPNGSWNGSWQMDAASSTQFFGRVATQGMGDQIIHTKNPANVGYGHPNAVGFDTSTQIFSTIFDANNQSKKVFANGSDIGNAASSYGGGAGTIAANGSFRIFVNRSNSQYPRGYLQEALVCLDTDTAIIQKIEGYLAHKHSIAGNLPADHPYKNSEPGYLSS